MNEAVSFENLSRNAMQLSAQVIIDAADLAFVLWPDGHIAKATLGKRTTLDIDTTGLKNRNVAEIVQDQDAAQLTDLVAKARDGQRPKPIKLRHSPLIQDGTVARYSAHLAGDGKNIVLLASALSAELSLSAQAAHAEIAQNHSKDRQMNEARYRMLFESSSEGLLVVERASGLIEQANGNAATIIGQSADGLIGTPLWSHFADDDEHVIHEKPSAPDHLDVTAQAVASGDLVRVSAQTVRSFLGTMLIVRLNKVSAQTAPLEADQNDLAVAILDQTSVPLLLTDGSGTITWCNGAFAALLSDDHILGEPVSEILSISSHALDLVLRQAELHGRAPTSLSALDSGLSFVEDARVTIVAVPAGPIVSYGFLIHMLGDTAAESAGRPESSALAELVGKAPLKTLVRKSTAEIERSCIEAALHLTGNNRAAAAGVLGVSRQSLYLKMRELRLR